MRMDSTVVASTRLRACKLPMLTKVAKSKEVWLPTRITLAS